MRFGENSSEVSYIANILRNTYIPTIHIGDASTRKKGYPYISCYPDSSIYDYNGNLVDKYQFGKHYLNISTNYKSDKDYYDSDLHEALGRYLRAYRDFYNIDVMAFYNCFSNRSTDAFSLPLSLYEDTTNQSRKISIKPYNAEYKLYAFPVYLNTSKESTVKSSVSYTIKFHGYVPAVATLQLAFYDGRSPVSIDYRVPDKDYTSAIIFKPTTYLNVDTINYSVNEIENFTSLESSPTVGSSNTDSTSSETPVDSPSTETRVGPTMTESERETLGIVNNLIYENRRLLYLFISVPSNWRGTVAVVEMKSDLTYSSTNWSLLQYNPVDSQQFIPYSNRLLEYLTGNVITPFDPVKEDIVRIQNIIDSTTYRNIYKTERTKPWKPVPGTFNNEMLVFLRKTLGESPVNLHTLQRGETKWVDFLGYIDKDVETALNSVKVLSEKLEGK